ncbi:MAG: 23S rRNA (uracil(1939)-C(5))-methyltransferase RlmD [Myxococcota bacterium]
MGRRRKKNIVVHIDRLKPKGVSGPIEGKSDKIATVKGASFGDRVLARPARKGKATLLEIQQPSSARITAKCPLFLRCGGCQLQHTTLEVQRQEKQKMVERLIKRPAVPFEPISGCPDGFAYRNKLELSFGTRQFLDETEHSRGDVQVEGHFLGMHPWGWYSKIVPVPNCALVSTPLNQILKTLQDLELKPAWNNHNHTGVWRHVVLREGDGIWITLVTSSEAQPTEMRNVAEALEACSDSIKGIMWVINDGIADVATGRLESVLVGSSEMSLTLGSHQFHLPYDAFFQVNTAGTEKLLDILSSIYSEANGKLFDLYCGVGTLGIALSKNFDSVLGIEVHEGAIEVARQNARLNQVDGEWYAGTVETLLHHLQNTENAHILVDPPRVGLHPKAAQKLADCMAKSLVYVACSPASLARDNPILEAGGWKLQKVYLVDLFPQTPHVESIAVFAKET